MKKVLVAFFCLALLGGIALVLGLFQSNLVSAEVTPTPTPTLERIIVDTGDPGYKETGLWQTTQLAGYDRGIVRSSATLGSTATWTVVIPVTGYYTVSLAFPKSTGADLACFTLNNKTFYVKQKAFAGDTFSLGNYSFTANNQVSVTLTVKSNGLHLADAVIFTRTPTQITPTPSCPCIFTTDTKVEAEGCPNSGGIINNGTYVSSCDDGDWLYLGTMIYSGESIVEVNAAIPSQSAGRSIEIRADSPYGTLLGTLNFVSSGSSAPNFYPQLTLLALYSSGKTNIPIYAIFRNGPNIGDVDYIRIFSVNSYQSEYRPVVSPTPPPYGTPTPTVTPTPTRRSTSTPTPTVSRVTPTPTRRVTPTPTRRVTPTPTTRATGCSVSYVIQSDWGNGATVSVTIQNNGSTAINGWTLAWIFPGNQTITNLWNGSYTQSGASVSVSNSASNAIIAAGGGLVNFGFNLSYSGANAKPTSFTLNGVPCQIQ